MTRTQSELRWSAHGSEQVLMFGRALHSRSSQPRASSCQDSVANVAESRAFHSPCQPYLRFLCPKKSMCLLFFDPCWNLTGRKRKYEHDTAGQHALGLELLWAAATFYWLGYARLTLENGPKLPASIHSSTNFTLLISHTPHNLPTAHLSVEEAGNWPNRPSESTVH